MEKRRKEKRVVYHNYDNTGLNSTFVVFSAEIGDQTSGNFEGQNTAGILVTQ